MRRAGATGKGSMATNGYRPAGAAGVQYVGLHDPRLGGPAYERDLAELRRQQAEFAEVRRRLDLQNGWMAAPVVAPVAAVAGLEALAAIGSRAIVPGGPLALYGPKAINRGGENVTTRYGREMHRQLEERIKQKSGWHPNPRLKGPDRRVHIPDARLPNQRHFGEYKPDTPSGHAAAARQIRRYEEAFPDFKFRGLFYRSPYRPRPK